MWLLKCILALYIVKVLLHGLKNLAGQSAVAEQNAGVMSSTNYSDACW